MSGLAISSVAASFSSPNVHTVDCASFQPLRSQHNPSRLVFGFHYGPTTILNCNHYLAGTSVSSNYSAREALKHSEMVYLLCKFQSHACSQSLAGYSVLKSVN